MCGLCAVLIPQVYTRFWRIYDTPLQRDNPESEVGTANLYFPARLLVTCSDGKKFVTGASADAIEGYGPYPVQREDLPGVPAGLFQRVYGTSSWTMDSFMGVGHSFAPTYANSSTWTADCGEDFVVAGLQVQTLGDDAITNVNLYCVYCECLSRSCYKNSLSSIHL